MASSKPHLQSSRKLLFGRTHVIQPKGEHRATVVWLHGRGDVGASWAEQFQEFPAQNIKWIVPTAPLQPITALGGYRCYAWFDGRPVWEGPDDLEGLDASAAHVVELLANESPNNLRKSYVVECDTCGSSIGAVLMQDGRVVAYESKILQGPEKTMQVYEKELSAVIHALLSWKHYLLGANFVVQTDHQTLRYFLTQAKLSEKHMRWANILSMFHFQIVHVEGKKNVVADALSRKPQFSAVSIPYHHELDDMREQYGNDEDFARIFEQLMDGQRHERYLLKDCFMMMLGSAVLGL
ncbi:hypothetical protein L7F22_068806 [Adiantum nelumboides]|nr:hypothetical protein [Adiantum nelumboides]